MPASAWHGRRAQLCTGEPGNAEEEPAVEPGNCASCAAERSGRVEAEPEEVRASSENAMGHWRSYRDRGVELVAQDRAQERLGGAQAWTRAVSGARC